MEGIILPTRSQVNDYSDQRSPPHLISFNNDCWGQVVDNAGQQPPQLIPDCNYETNRNENILTIRGQVVDNAGQRSPRLAPSSSHNIHVADKFNDEDEFVDPRDLARRQLQSYHPQVARPNNKEGYKTIIQEGESLGTNWDITMNRLLTSQEERIRKLEEGICMTESAKTRIESLEWEI